MGPTAFTFTTELNDKKSQTDPFHMREWWTMVLDQNRNPFRSFAVELNDLNWIRGPKNPKKSFLVVLGV